MDFLVSDLRMIAKLLAIKRYKRGIVAWSERNTDPATNGTPDFFYAADDIELANNGSEFIGVVHETTPRDITGTVEIDAYRRTSYIILDELIVKICTDPLDEERRLYHLLDTGRFNYSQFVGMLKSVGLSSDILTWMPNHPIILFNGEGHVNFTSATDISEPFFNGLHPDIIRRTVRTKFDAIGVSVGDFVWIPYEPSNFCMAGYGIHRPVDFTLSRINWVPASPHHVAELLDDMVNARLDLMDLIALCNSSQTHSIDIAVSNVGNSILQPEFWAAARPAVVVRKQRWGEISFEDYFPVMRSVFLEHLNRGIRQMYDTIREEMTAGRTSASATRPLPGEAETFTEEDREMAQAISEAIGPIPADGTPEATAGLTRESFREAMELFRRSQPNRGGDGQGWNTTSPGWGDAGERRTPTPEEIRGVRSSRPPTLDELVHMTGSESASIPFGDQNGSDDLASSPQSGIASDCERSMMIAPPE